MALKVDIIESDGRRTNTDFAVECFITAADGVSAENVTGWSLSWMLKKRSRDADAAALITKNTVSGITIVDGAAGHVRVTIHAADTASPFVGGQYRHELKRTDVGFKNILIEGEFYIGQALHLSV